MNRKVRVECNANMSLELDDMNVFQGELKHLPEENYEKFKTDVLELGISSSFDVWRNPDDAKWYLIDGHQRKTGLTRMRDKEAFEIPLLPCTVVHARDFREAKKKVLALTSQFGVMTKKGLHDFMTANDFTLDEIDDFTVLPGIDHDEFAKEYFPTKKDSDFDPGTQGEQGKLDEKHLIFITCPNCSERFERGQATTEN